MTNIIMTSKRSMTYLIAAMFCALFGAVYEIFSHGVFSFYMIYAFAFPLFLGCFPYLILSIKGIRKVNTISDIVYNFSIAILTIGSMVCGVLEIYGTTNDLTNIYWLVGIILFLTGSITGLLSIKKDRSF